MGPGVVPFLLDLDLADLLSVEPEGEPGRLPSCLFPAGASTKTVPAVLWGREVSRRLSLLVDGKGPVPDDLGVTRLTGQKGDILLYFAV